MVLIKGKEVRGLVGKETDKIRLYAADPSGQKRLIPFQIDEKANHNGRRDWALTSLSPAKGGASPANGTLDPDEVILFFNRDAGSPLDLGNFSEAEKLWEIWVDSKGNNRVYLTYDANPSVVSFPPAVKVAPHKDSYETNYYQMGFAKAHPLIQDLLVIKNSSSAPDLLDRFKVRFDLAINNFFDLSFNEEKIKSRLVGYKTGPIRALRRLTAWKSLGPIKLMPRSNIDFVFYPDWVDVTTQINNPVDGPKRLEEKTKGVSGFDFNKNILGSIFYTNMGGPPVRLDGIPEADPQKTESERLKWWALSGPKGSVVVQILNDPKLMALKIYPILVLKDDPKQPNAPESEAGEIFIGFDLPYHRIPKGRYAVQVKQVYPRPFQSGREAVYLKEAKVVEAAMVRNIK